MRSTTNNQTSSLSFVPKKWDSDFFGRQIMELSFNKTLDRVELETALSKLDKEGVWGIEARVYPERMSDIPTLEDVGFRLVDSKMSFLSHLQLSDIGEIVMPYGRLRRIRKTDLPLISELTTKTLIDNPVVYSRYKDPRLFTREESIRYYDAWNQRAYIEQPELFVVWEADDKVIAYFNYMRVSHPDLKPLFKGILTAVAPAHRGQNAHNIMQSYLFERFGESEWWVDNTTQISNVAVIRNHVKAGKVFDSSSLIFFRTGFKFNHIESVLE